MIKVIAQIIGFVALFISLIAYHRKDKKSIISNLVICNLFKLVHYLLLGAYSGCVTKIIAIIRDGFIIIKERNTKLSNNLFLLFFIMLYVIAAFFTYDGILSLFPLVAPLIYTLFIWNGNELVVKKTAFYCYFIWLVYNIFVFSIPEIIANILGIISTFIAIKNYKKV